MSKKATFESEGFHSIGPIDAIPDGEGKSLQIDGVDVAVFRDGSEIYAMDDHCPHAGAPLGAGGLNNGHVICPFHGWVFNMKTGACPTAPNRPVQTFQTRIDSGEGFVKVSS
jgi:nitrite reductase (NADH) small subunit/3-phenylpropionate/trans-cinnamate dioxygenase ferredoxin subunit